MESILDSIKKLLGIGEDDHDFDDILIIHINSSLSILNQLGVGPQEGFKIYDFSETWSMFLGDSKNIEDVKTYVYLRVKADFDPPQNSFLVNTIEKKIEELGWRLNVACDNK